VCTTRVGHACSLIGARLLSRVIRSRLAARAAASSSSRSWRSWRLSRSCCSSSATRSRRVPISSVRVMPGPRVAEQFLDLVQRSSRVQHVRGESMSQLMRMHRARQARSPRQHRQQIVDRTRPHRRPQWRVEQVDQHEITVTSLSTPIALEDIRVIREHHQIINRNRPRSAGLRPRAVRIRPAPHMQMRSGHRAAQTRRIGDEMQCPRVVARTPRHAADPPVTS
jgi:hypothetical protein